MIILANPFQMIEYSTYVLLGITWLLLVWNIYKKGSPYIISGFVLFTCTTFLAIVYYMQNFLFVFNSQGLEITILTVLKYGLGIILSCLSMILFLALLYATERNELNISAKWKIVMCVIIILFAFYYSWNVGRIDEMEIKLLIIFTESLVSYQRFAILCFATWCFSSARKSEKYSHI